MCSVNWNLNEVNEPAVVRSRTRAEGRTRRNMKRVKTRKQAKINATTATRDPFGSFSVTTRWCVVKKAVEAGAFGLRICAAVVFLVRGPYCRMISLAFPQCSVAEFHDHHTSSSLHRNSVQRENKREYSVLAHHRLS